MKIFTIIYRPTPMKEWFAPWKRLRSSVALEVKLLITFDLGITGDRRSGEATGKWN